MSAVSLGVLGMGLGTRILVQELVAKHANPDKIVFILNLSNSERETISRSLLSSGSKKRLQVITSDASVKERQKLYLSGGCFAVTKRILIVDFLNDLIPVDLVSGLIINHAHRVKENSTEAFIVRVFKRKSSGFIQALSDDARAFVSGFSKCEKAMQSLMVKDLYLYPRFHVTVGEDLKRASPEIVELYPTLSTKMEQIQAAIGEVLIACLAELKAKNKVALQDITSEDCLFRNPELRVRQALQPTWNRVTAHSKGLVQDLGTLSGLLTQLLSLDSIAFYEQLRKIRYENTRHRSRPGGMNSRLWMLTEGADRLFRLSRDRVFEVISDTPITAPLKDLVRRVKSRGGVKKILEPNPKWELLVEVLKEIAQEVKSFERELKKGEEEEEEKEKKKVGGEGQKSGPPHRHRRRRIGKTVIFARDLPTCERLRRYLSSPSEYMTSTWKQFLLEHHTAKSRFSFDHTKTYSAKERELIALRVGLDHAAAVVATKERRQQIQQQKQQQQQQQQQQQTSSSAASKTHNHKGVVGFEKKRHEKKANTSNSSSLGKDDCGTNSASTSTSKRKSCGGRTKRHSALDAKNFSLSSSSSSSSPNSPSSKQISEASVKELVVVQKLPQFLIHPFEDADGILESYEPEYVVCFDADVRILRLVGVKLYFLAHDDSVETQRYESIINRERNAFEKLISQKERLMVLLPHIESSSSSTRNVNDNANASQHKSNYGDDDDGFARLLQDDHYDSKVIVQASSSAAAAMTYFGESSSQGLGTSSLQYDVGTLEMNAITRRLYQKGLEIIPATLEVGDYILSPEIAVERKSISDLKPDDEHEYEDQNDIDDTILLGGLASGRLHHQLQVLCRTYKRPVLLIEFSRNWSFGFAVSSYIQQGKRDAINFNDITSKIALLTLHFPTVRLIWSKGADFTAEMFDRLKKNEPEPTMDEAIAIGTDKDTDNGDGELPLDVLLQLPGITVHNYRRIVNNVGNLQELSRLTQQELSDLIGQSGGRKLYEFMHEEMKQTIASM
eukprot:jgi/Bigna1/73579/fgenesh1_pg.25_\